MNNLQPQQIEQIASKVIEDQNISALPIDPFQIAYNKNIMLEKKPGLSGGVSGMLIRHGEEYAIGYRDDIENEGYKRFSVAHELGHYFLPEHPERVFNNNDIHNSRAGFNSGDKYELEADRFAAALLMPENIINKVMYKTDDGLDTVVMLSKLCITSLEATAIRYVQKTSIPAVVIRSQNNRIDYCFMSNSMKHFGNFTWIKKGDVVPVDTVTFHFNEDNAKIGSSHKESKDTDLQNWFNIDRSMPAFEEVIGLGKYGKILTIITSETPSDEIDD